MDELLTKDGRVDVAEVMAGIREKIREKRDRSASTATTRSRR